MGGSGSASDWLNLKIYYAFRDVSRDPATVLASFVKEFGGEATSAPAVASAAYLALEAGNRKLYSHYRRVLLDTHIDNLYVAPVTSIMLDRFHRYRIFFHPSSAI